MTKFRVSRLITVLSGRPSNPSQVREEVIFEGSLQELIARHPYRGWRYDDLRSKVPFRDSNHEASFFFAVSEDNGKSWKTIFDPRPYWEWPRVSVDQST